MKRFGSVIIALAIVLCLSACGNIGTDSLTSSDEVPQTTVEVAEFSVEETIAQIRTYPLNVDSAYADFAVSIPKVIFSTTASENGLAGCIYTFVGTVEKVNTYEDEEGTFTYMDAIVVTDDGPVTITNLFKSIYDATVKAYGEADTKTVYTDDVSNYIFPSEGETAQFIVIYLGYSQKDNLPVFILGASHDLYEMADLIDPVERQNESHIASSTKKENGIYGNTVVIGYITFTIPDGFTATAVNDKTFMLSSDDGTCSFSLFAADISGLDEIKTKLYLPQQSELFDDDKTLIGDIDTIDGFVAGYDVVMDLYSVMDGVKLVTAMDGTFTDSWYAYTVMLRSNSGDNLSDNIHKFAEFTAFAEHDGPDARFDFVQ